VIGPEIFFFKKNNIFNRTTVLKKKRKHRLKTQQPLLWEGIDRIFFLHGNLIRPKKEL